MYGTHMFFPFMANMETLWKHYGHNFPYYEKFSMEILWIWKKFLWPYYGRNRIFHNFPYYGKNFHSMENLWRSICHKFPYHIFFTSCDLLFSALSTPNLDASVVTPVIAIELSANEEYGRF